MSRQVLNNNDLFGIQRGKINDNFLELWTIKLEEDSVLIKTNTTPYTPANPYNPATKGYVDSIQVSWAQTYDPTTVAGDAFLRSNHHGRMEAQYITQTSDYRFASDLEKTTWNAKEPNIGAKGTAFNKSFGTVGGAVSEGNHNHINDYEPKAANIQNHISDVATNPHSITKATIGLSDVENYSSADLPISDDTQTALDLKQDAGILTDVDVVEFDTTAGLPTYAEGKLFYDLEHNALSYYNHISESIVNIAKEFIGDIYNDTGSTIPNGTPIRSTGVTDVTTSRPKVEPAQANDFGTSRIVGVTTHDVATGSAGVATNMGVVHGVDTSGFSEGDLLYLSDTVAGSYTAIPPDIITIVGGVIHSDATEGTIFVLISNNVALPGTYAVIDSVAATYNLTTAYQDIIGYGSEDSIVDGSDTTNGLLIPHTTGKFRGTVNMTMTVPTSPSSRTITIQVWDETDSAEIMFSTITVSKDATQVSRSFSKLFDALDDHEYTLRLKSSVAITGVTFDDISFDIVSVNTR